VDIHQNARLTARRREELALSVISGALTIREGAEDFGVCTTTVRKGVRRYQQEGPDGMTDRSSRPRISPSQIAVSMTASIEVLRRQRQTGRQISQQLGISKATVHRVLDRRGLNHLTAIELPTATVRYEHDTSGALVHLDIKKLGCIGRVGHRIHGDRRRGSPGIGWEFVHVAIDDHSRLGFSRVMVDERHPSAVAFLNATVAYYRALGIPVKAILTDNGSCYRSRAFRQACTNLGLKHRFTRPYRPRTNGKAERFIQTLLREWAYAKAYECSADRTAHLGPWLHHYNWHRPHGSLDRKSPASRLGLDKHNLLRLHI
jgi:transposase InsO family protein